MIGVACPRCGRQQPVVSSPCPRCNGLLGSVSSIPQTAARRRYPQTPTLRGGEAEPSKPEFLESISDPRLRAAILAAYRAWEKAL